MKGLIFLQNIEEQLEALYNEDMATIEARIKTKAKHRKSRKGQFKSKEKKCLRGEGNNLINSQCIFKKHVRKYRRNGIIWDYDLYYSDKTPKYFMIDCRRQELYFFDEFMRTMFVFSFACDIYDFFIPDKEIYPWDPYKEAYREYTGEYFEETRDRVYPPKYRVIDREIIGYKNENKYRIYKNLQSTSKWYKKLHNDYKLRTAEKQVFDKLKKVEDIEDYDYVFPRQAKAEYVY